MLQRWCLILSITGLLVACGGPTHAPVSERAVPSEAQSNPAQYFVQKGDTLYSIAFRYGMDYRELAAINGIDSRYSIYPGQRLALKSVTVPASAESIVRDSSIVAPKPIITSTRTTASSSSSSGQPVSTSKAPVQSVSKAPAVTPKPKSAPKASKAKSIDVKQVVQTKTSGRIHWKWPVYGRVMEKFKTKGTVNKGVDIAGKKGQSIKAAAPGKVVYAGNGLLGYGNLVIIDHNQQFLSAYAHNSRVLVKENDMVKTGQKIAEMGSSGADRVMLHFEIRRDGKPVDPLRYLPKQ